ncbi:TetR/AcrR family transcriptional regulator [Oceanobacillus arenosus]|uniref:TetR/AcrR family transcriptional regulator n=1 Tax=Oceanobacillus arenosus TaxID=1229153 RepID=A0A3D8PQJ3_9BACI|nr:TetR/AcrR family transcriptional regulator [Oceanobacillus arenosus]RDW18373.1 TetR/AcrR family transcriptional regulator [Oceanobacillus arenosus]
MTDKYMYLDKRVMKTKQELKVAIITLMQQKKYKDITISDVIAMAKISRGTFYNHYRSKEELLLELLDDVVLDLVQAYQQPYKKYRRFTLNDVLPSSVEIFDHVYKHSNFYTTIINSDISPHFQARLIDVLNKIALQDYIIRNRKINSELYAGYQAFVITGMIIEWVRSGYRFTPSYMAQQLMEIVKLPGHQSLERIKGET